MAILLVSAPVAMAEPLATLQMVNLHQDTTSGTGWFDVVLQLDSGSSDFLVTDYSIGITVFSKSKSPGAFQFTQYDTLAEGNYIFDSHSSNSSSSGSLSAGIKGFTVSDSYNQGSSSDTGVPVTAGEVWGLFRVYFSGTGDATIGFLGKGGGVGIDYGGKLSSTWLSLGDPITVSSVPEPTPLVLSLLGGCGAIIIHRAFRRQRSTPRN